MPLFGESSSPYDAVLEKATNETSTTENWALILDIADKVQSQGAKGAKDCLLSVKKRLNHRDPHVIVLALSVLDSLVSNASKLMLNAICTREFMSELLAKCTMSNHQVAERTRILVKKWSVEHPEAEYDLLAALVKQLTDDGYSFESSEPKKTVAAIPKDPNYVSSAEEEVAIMKAIQESLKDSKSAPTQSLSSNTTITTQSLYPSNNTVTQHTTVTNGESKAPKGSNNSTRVVKALYDFEAAEDNELTFKAGELITVMDESDMNWWRGSNARGEGLFPANFVTHDLSEQVEGETDNMNNDAGRKVMFDENVQVKQIEQPPAIDEEVIARCLTLLEDADPTGNEPDDEALPQLEERCAAMGPLINEELAEIDAKYNQLAEVDVKLRDALALYDNAMQMLSQHMQVQQTAPQQHQPGHGQGAPHNAMPTGNHHAPQNMAPQPQHPPAMGQSQGPMVYPPQQQMHLNQPAPHTQMYQPTHALSQTQAQQTTPIVHATQGQQHYPPQHYYQPAQSQSAAQHPISYPPSNPNQPINTQYQPAQSVNQTQ